jgi:hypothetical protein
MTERTGRRTVPQIYIDDFHVGGFDDLVEPDRSAVRPHAGRVRDGTWSARVVRLSIAFLMND